MIRTIHAIQSLSALVLGLLLHGCNVDSWGEPDREDSRLIAIQPYEGFPQELVDTVQACIRSEYGFQTVVYPAIPLPEIAFVNIKSPRYRADTLIAILKRSAPDSLRCVIGLTHKDISTTKRDESGAIKKPESRYADWGIFGLGYRPGPSCVVSIKRLKHKDESVFMDRLLKVSLHEVGHNLGLPHCPSQQCLMKDANESIKTIDNEPLMLCDKCKEVL